MFVLRVFLIGWMCLGSLVLAQGALDGTVRSDDGPIANAEIDVKAVEGTFNAEARTDAEGKFLIRNIPVGTYNIEITADGYESYIEPGVEIANDSTVNLNVTMIKPINVMVAMTVASASRRPERIVEAPAAITVIEEEVLEAAAASSQMPKVLQDTPGVELAQSGVFDFNVNARGFNSSLNRRILVLIDGRDPATGFLGNQEWAAISNSLDQYESVEWVRGPGSALYGANAFNGVLNITSKQPKDDLGGRFSLTAGTLDTLRVTLKYAGEFGDGWSYRVQGGDYSSNSWSVSRTANDLNPNGEFEYPGLGTPELVPLDNDKTTSSYMGLRVDKDFINGHVLTLEAATNTSENGVALTGIGRVQINESERPWFRVNYNMPNWNFMYSWSGRDTPEGQTLLATGTLLYEDSVNQHGEVQANYDFWGWPHSVRRRRRIP